MTVSRPENHVTRAMKERIGMSPQSFLRFRGVTLELLKALQEEYPPRCKDRGESEEQHQRYAGKVELVAQLADSYEAQKAIEYDPEENEDNLSADAERAR